MTQVHCLTFTGKSDDNVIEHIMPVQNVFDIQINTTDKSISYISSAGSKVTQSFEDEETFGKYRTSYRQYFGVERPPESEVVEEEKPKKKKK